MNILIINYEYPPLGGGGGIFTRDLAEELAKKHTVDLLTSGYKGLKKKETAGGVNVFRLPVIGRSSLAAASMMSLLSFVPSCRISGTHALKGRRYDIINTHFAVPTGPAGTFFSKTLNIPNVLSIHGGDIYDPSKRTSPHLHRSLRHVVRNVMNSASEVVAQSTDTRENALSIYSPEKDIRIIHLGIPDPPETKTSRSELGLDEDAVYMISVGRLVKRKGYDFLIKALYLLRDKHPSLKLILIGNGPEHGYLKDLARELGVYDRIVFKRNADDDSKFRHLSVSDLYVLSSMHEGFGIVLLEAMYYALPIVATNKGGQTDIIKEDVNGYLTKPSDEKDLAGAIDRMITLEDRREFFSIKNKADFDKYRISYVAGKYEELFTGILNTR